jgi:hypothetical protein
MKTHTPPQIHAAWKLAHTLTFKWPIAFVSLWLAAASTCFGAAPSVVIKSNPLRITVPYGASLSSTTTVTVITANLVDTSGDVVNFTVTGVPAGVSATFRTNSINANGTATVNFEVSSPASLAQGTYDLAIVGSGSASYRLPVPLICAVFWSGSAFTNGVSTNWAYAGNWLAGSVPGATDDVVLSDSGGTNNITDGPTNVIVTADAAVGSLRFAAQQSANSKAYNIQINSGASLSVVGPNGLSMLRDSKDIARTMDVKFVGNGRLVVSNSAANFSSLIDAQQNASLNMTNLDNFYAEVNRLPLGDYRAYPNFKTNGWTGSGTSGANEVSRFAPLVWLARTNVIKASFVDPNNYDDLGWRDYALTIGNYSEQGTTSNLRFSMGYSNAFFLDSICFSQALQGGSGHQYNFWNDGSYALFRGTGGLTSRMSVFAVADSGSPAAPRAANTRGQVNFGLGTVDALVDRLFMGVDRTNNLSQMTIQATMTLSNCTFDVNKAYLGYQRSGNNLGASTATGFAGPEGTVTVNSPGVFRVNDTLHLGYTTASAAGGTTSPERCWGRVNINGGTVMASNIVCGGVTKLSTNNQIVLSGGRLIVTNAIGAADARVAVFTLGGGAEVTLLGAVAEQTNIFVDTFSAVTAGGPQRINIPSIAGVTTYPVRVRLVSYTSTVSPVFSGLYIVPPAGVFVKSVVDNTIDKTIDVTFSDEPPIVVVWRGNVNNRWDLATPNWVTQSGGTQTNYSDGFSVVFDDTVGAGPTSIDIPAAVVPGQAAAAYGVVVSNKSYTFNSGSMLGGATVYKTGTGNLTINANLTTAVTINSGALAGTGTNGPTLLQAGSTMTAFTGTINGGLAASNANVTVNGPVNGGLNLQAGNLVNAATINGRMTVATNTTLYNWYGATMNVTLPWTVPTNSVLVNNGVIRQFGTPSGNLGLTVNGTLEGIGLISSDGLQASSDVRVTIGAGGNLMIGNSLNEITNTTIAVRLDLLADSTTTIDVDTTRTNDFIALQDSSLGFPIQGKVNFGAANTRGGTIVINHIGGPPFDTSTVIHPFDLFGPAANLPDNASPAIPGITPPPLPGYTWDTTEVITNLTLLVTTPPVMTNVITSTNITFSWTANARGWRLEQLTNSLEEGLGTGITNWTTVVTTLGGTNVVYYPDITNFPDFYYMRSVQTIYQTNPHVFFRLAYP